MNIQHTNVNLEVLDDQIIKRILDIIHKQTHGLCIDVYYAKTEHDLLLRVGRLEIIHIGNGVSYYFPTKETNELEWKRTISGDWSVLLDYFHCNRDKIVLLWDHRPSVGYVYNEKSEGRILTPRLLLTKSDMLLTSYWSSFDTLYSIMCGRKITTVVTMPSLFFLLNALTELDCFVKGVVGFKGYRFNEKQLTVKKSYTNDFGNGDYPKELVSCSNNIERLHHLTTIGTPKSFGDDKYYELDTKLFFGCEGKTIIEAY